MAKKEAPEKFRRKFVADRGRPRNDALRNLFNMLELSQAEADLLNDISKDLQLKEKISIEYCNGDSNQFERAPSKKITVKVGVVLIEAILLETINRHYGQNFANNENDEVYIDIQNAISADVVLMSLGLLKHFYHYEHPEEKTGRGILKKHRIAFLRRSFYLEKLYDGEYKGRYHTYEEAENDGVGNKICKTLEKAEKRFCDIIADELYYNHADIILYISQHKEEFFERSHDNKYNLKLPEMRQPRPRESNNQSPEIGNLNEQSPEVLAKINMFYKRAGRIKRLSEKQEKEMFEFINMFKKNMYVLGITIFFTFAFVVRQNVFASDNNLASQKPPTTDWAINKNISTEDAPNFNNEIDMDEFFQDIISALEEHKKGMVAQNDL